jgi:hypothetical protein
VAKRGLNRIIQKEFKFELETLGTRMEERFIEK